MSVAIVIPTYNRIDTLRRLLPGYLLQAGYCCVVPHEAAR